MLFLALGVVASLGVVAEAGAKKKSRAKSHEGSVVTVQAVGPDGVTGQVSGNHSACRTQRHVTVYRVNSGPSVPSSEFVASTWTRGDGSWEIRGPVFPSEFFAVVDQKSAKRAVCSAATSNSLAWG